MAGVDNELNLEWVHEFADADITVNDMMITSDGGVLLGGTLEGEMDVPALLKTGPLSSQFASVTISVEDQDGVPVAGASVAAMTKTDVGISGASDESGVALFEYVSPGTHTVQVIADGYETETVQVMCSAGASTEATVSLSQILEPVSEPEQSVLAISVMDEERAPIGGVSVASVSTPEGQGDLSGNTDTAGDVEFNVLAGSYEFKLSRASFETETVTCAISGDEQLVVVLAPEASEDTSSGDDSTTSTDAPDFSDVQEVPSGNGGNNMLLIGAFVVIVLVGAGIYYMKSKSSN